MDKEIKKDIKKLLLLDSLLTSTYSISRIFDEVEAELEELMGKSKKSRFQIDDLLKYKNLK
ncbi:MAG TPA: hypothetical protein VEF53_20805 [Patescibacteria group bacterium]|nr:hypothetical protein [Patescibacteria group bacterium]